MTPICNFKHPIDCGGIEKEDEINLSMKLLRLVIKEEKETQLHEEAIEIINLGIKDDKKEIKISTLIENDMRGSLIKLLHEYKDVFT